MAEKWKEYYSEEQIKTIQKLEMVNLQELQRVCDIIGVSFFLYGGSLIGAVRHKGFVPWDDDLDIAMLRVDYEKFVSLAPRFLGEGFFLQTPYNDKKSPYFYSKLRLKGTQCVEYGSHKLDIEHGIYVDIYPIDNLPDNEEEYIKQYNRYQKIVKLFVLRQCPHRYELNVGFRKRLKALIRYSVSCSLKIIPHQLFVILLDKISTKSNRDNTVRCGNYSFPEPKNQFVDILPYEIGIFEGVKVCLPKHWDEHLTMRYGDYMELPPIEERIGHRPYLLDFGKYE